LGISVQNNCSRGRSAPQRERHIFLTRGKEKQKKKLARELVL